MRAAAHGLNLVAPHPTQFLECTRCFDGCCCHASCVLPLWVDRHVLSRCCCASVAGRSVGGWVVSGERWVVGGYWRRVCFPRCQHVAESLKNKTSLNIFFQILLVIRIYDICPPAIYFCYRLLSHVLVDCCTAVLGWSMDGYPVIWFSSLNRPARATLGVSLVYVDVPSNYDTVLKIFRRQ